MALVKTESKVKYAIPTPDILKQVRMKGSSKVLGKSSTEDNIRITISIDEKESKPVYLDDILREKENDSEEYFKTLNELLSLRVKRDTILKFANDCVEEILQESFRKISDRKLLSKDEESKFPALSLSMTDLAQKDYPDLFDLASDFIDSILYDSRRRVTNIKLVGNKRLQRYNSPNEFKPSDGLKIVTKCISPWPCNPNWYFKIIYNGRMIAKSHSFFYTVRWSVPTPAYPVAQVTVDIYFTVEVIPMTPPPVFIEVYYRMETDRSRHCAFNSTFMEKSLRSIVKRKLEAFQMFKF